MKSKKCNKCGEVKLVEEFGKHSSRKDGLRGVCKKCNNNAARDYALANRDSVLEKKRRYYKENKDRFAEYHKERMEDESFRERKSNVTKSWYLDNKASRKLYAKSYYEKNKPTYMACSARRRAAKRNQTPAWADHDAIKAFL